MFQRPISGAPISATYPQHQGRTPPSREPGVDYAVPRGTLIVAPARGVIRVMDNHAGGDDGRRFMIEYDNGDWGSGIHLNESRIVNVGQVVRQGVGIAYSGQSRRGWNIDPSMGAHLHYTHWVRPGRMPIPGFTPPQDFEAILAAQDGSGAGGGGTPIPVPIEEEEDDMRRITFMTEAGRVWYLVTLDKRSKLTHDEARAWTAAYGGDTNFEDIHKEQAALIFASIDRAAAQ